MENHRRIRTLAAGLGLAVLAVSTAKTHATGGGWFDEVPQPTLNDSLDMLPAKSLGQIFLETTPKHAESEEPDFDEEIGQIAQRLRKKEPAEKLLRAVDDLLVKAREHYTDGDTCNVLHDVRDVISASSADADAAADYIERRLKNKDLSPEVEERAQAAKGPLKAHWLYLSGAVHFKVGDRKDCQKWFDRVVAEFPKHPRAEFALFLSARCSLSQSRADGISEEDQIAARKTAVAKFEAYRKKYPNGRLTADVLGWLGALAFDSGEYLKALDFYIAQAETPGHPETLKSAIFMCEKSLARVAAEPDGNAAFALVARHPRIAMGFTYLVLSAPEADNYDGKFDKPADVKKWRRTILPRIAAAVTKQQENYKSSDWQPRYLAMLAQAASAAGNQEQALQLAALAPEQLERSDDLLFVRALALQRAGKAHEAVEAYRKLLGRFRKTPLARGARLRLALALEDDHQAGEAVAMLKRLLGGKISDEKAPDAQDEEAESENYIGDSRYTHESEYPPNEEDWKLGESAVYPNISGADSDQIQQAIDALLNFAPLTELSAALSSRSFDEDGKKELRAVIAERYLAQENFAEARKFMLPEQFAAIAANLEKVTQSAASANPPKDKAEQMLQLGNLWAEARGKLLRVPLDTGVNFLNRYRPLDLMARRENGRALGRTNVDTELEERDELRHASRWWMRAARALPGTPLAAQARWKALEAMPNIARASEYAEQRAREIKGEAVSRELYEKLRSECPDSVEAKRYAAYWSFPKPPEPEKDENGEPKPAPYVDPYERRKLDEDAWSLGYPVYDFGLLDVADSDSSKQEDSNAKAWAEIEPRVLALHDHAIEWEPAKMAAEARELAALARRNLSEIESANCVNFLDDLAQFFSEKNLTREMQQIYVNLRLDVLRRTSWEGAPIVPAISPGVGDSDEAVEEEIKRELENPIMKPVADYLAFALIGMTAGEQIAAETDIVDPKESQGTDTPPSHVTYPSRDFEEMEKMTREFLKKYPHSRKREAALFVLARSVQALSRPFICAIDVPVPGTIGSSVEYDEVQKSYQKEPFDPKRVLGALDDYDREFPNGRYASDIRNLRAATLWRMHDWPKALDLTLAQFEDASQPDLQPEAALRLANIFAELANTEHRADVLEAIRTRPAAVRHLKTFLSLAPKFRDHPLRYLGSYLSDQLGVAAKQTAGN